MTAISVCNFINLVNTTMNLIIKENFFKIPGWTR